MLPEINQNRKFLAKLPISPRETKNIALTEMK